MTEALSNHNGNASFQTNALVDSNLNGIETTSRPSPTPSFLSSASSSPWIRKPLSVVHQQEADAASAAQARNGAHLQRHLSVWDLIGIGVGGTVGSGIFVLTGQIAAHYSGQLCWLSWTIAGAAACLSGCCYAELSAHIPAAGSTYVYAYVCLGEWAAVLAAACLTLEYGISGAAVARTWGDKVLHWMQFSTDSVVNLPAFVISAACTILLLSGVQESKRVMNIVTLIKMMVVVFMIVAGFSLYDPDRLDGIPTTPSGPSGVLRGATTSFFGYLGYDEVCCVAGEAKHPGRDMPRAVLGTLLTVTICYILAAIALTGMLPYTDISPDAGFPDAFDQRGMKFAAQLTATGEIATLPVVVIISLMAQPRLTLSMAVDGLLPKVFQQVDDSGNLWGGTLISGIVMTITATFIPFNYLDDLISAGILIAFCMTNCCLVLLRSESPIHQDGLLEKSLATYNGLCFITALLWSHAWNWFPYQNFVASILLLATISVLMNMARKCHNTEHFGGSILRDSISLQRYSNAHVVTQSPADISTIQFKTPWVPYLPCIGMAVNWYLIAQLDWKGVLMLLLYLGATTLVYMFGCAPHSVGHNKNWNSQHSYRTIVAAEHDGEPATIVRANSM